MQNYIRGGSNPSSLVSQIFSASKSNTSYIAKPASSWIDDYEDWIHNENCCKFNKTTHGFCPNQAPGFLCDPCQFHYLGGEVLPADFRDYLPWFLLDNPSQQCPKAGHAAYGGGVNIQNNDTVESNYFLTYHTILKKSSDYTNALREARAIADNITRTIQAGKFPNYYESMCKILMLFFSLGTNMTTTVFPYSIFYVFYEQYLTMWEDTLKSVSISVSAIFVVTVLLTGFHFQAAGIVICTIIMILINLGGLMYWWSISLNAISLVNLVMVSNTFFLIRTF